MKESPSKSRMQHQHYRFMCEAVEEARKGLQEGGVPVGAVLSISEKVAGRGHNRRAQKGSVVLHAETDCLENAGRLKKNDYARSTLYTTLSPCDMCTGAILLYGIPTVVIGENSTYKGPEKYLKKRGIEIINLDLEECKDMMTRFIQANPELWNEDIGK